MIGPVWRLKIKFAIHMLDFSIATLDFQWLVSCGVVGAELSALSTALFFCAQPARRPDRFSISAMR
jgi:hypothetical protein